MTGKVNTTHHNPKKSKRTKKLGASAKKLKLGTRFVFQQNNYPENAAEAELLENGK